MRKSTKSRAVDIECPSCGVTSPHEVATILGSIKTPKKAKASAANGAKGGRPRDPRGLRVLKAERKRLSNMAPGKVRNAELRAVSRTIARRESEKRS